MMNPGDTKPAKQRFSPAGIAAVVLLGLLGSGQVLAAAKAGSSSKPNVIVIMPDDLSYDDYGCYNHRPDAPRTPHFDRLAGTSVALADFHVAPTCSPSRAQLLTGRYNHAGGVWHTVMGRYFLRGDEVTMADVFKANGYRTALFGKWHLGDDYPFRPKDRGFERVVMLMGGGIDQQQNPWGNRNTPPCILFSDDKPVVLDGKNGPFATDYFTTEAIAYMRQRQAKQEPFFVYLPYNAAHGPHDMPPDAREGVDARTATIENLDKNLGRLLRFLDESGLAENTLLVSILGDNGMANQLFRGNKATEYEAGHRVPCLIRWPARGYTNTITGTREVAPLTSELDLLPTFIDLLGMRDVAHRPPELAFDGRSLKTLLDEEAANDDPRFATRVLVVDNQRLDGLVKYKQACVMQDRREAGGRIVRKWRLMRSSASRAWELYDIQADPRQQTNLLQQSQDESLKTVAQALEAAYEDWWRKVSARAAEFGRPVIGSPNQPAVCLYSHDWHMEDGTPPWNQSMVAAGMGGNGFHAVTLERAGNYTFDLRRWPREIADGTSVDSALCVPVLSAAKDNAPSSGKALPIRAARIRIWNGDQTLADERKEMKAGSDGSAFILPLPAGPAMVQTWFYDADGHELCGAYYVYVTRK